MNVLKHGLSSNNLQSKQRAGVTFPQLDHLHTVTQVLKKTTEYTIPIYKAYVDNEKAFDSCQHRAVFEALKARGVQEKNINIIKETYTGRTC